MALMFNIWGGGFSFLILTGEHNGLNRDITYLTYGGFNHHDVHHGGGWIQSSVQLYRFC